MIDSVDLNLSADPDALAIARGAARLLRLKDRARRLVHHEAGDEFLAAQHRQARRVERHAAVTVGRTVDWVDHHRELAAARDARLFTHNSKSRAAQDTKRDLVRHEVQVILRRAHTRKSTPAMVFHGFANLERARAKWRQNVIAHVITLVGVPTILSSNGRH